MDLDQPIHKLRNKFVLGVDCEWRPPITKYDKKGVSIMQVGDKEDILLTDMMSMSSNQILISILKQVIEDQNILIPKNGF